MGNGDITVRSEGKMVSNETWNTLYKQAAEIIKSGFLPTSIKTPAQAIAVILTGRELGIGMMEAFRGIHIIDNRPSISPQLMMSLIYNSGVAENIKIESTPTYCTVSGNRRGQPPVTAKFTEDDAKDMGLLYRDNWKKQKQNMLRWRAISAWARLVCPDVIGGLYTPEELDTEEYKDSVEGAKETLALSEKLNSSPDEYEKWRQEITTKILDEIVGCDTTLKLTFLKKKYTADIEHMLDEDRQYIMGEIDTAFQNLVSGVEPEIQASGEVIDRKTGQEVKLEENAPQNTPNSETQGKDSELDKQEAFSKEFVQKAIKELDTCQTSAQLNVWKNKNAQDIKNCLKEYGDYIRQYLANRYNKLSGKR